MKIVLSMCLCVIIKCKYEKFIISTEKKQLFNWKISTLAKIILSFCVFLSVESYQLQMCKFYFV